MPQVLWPLLVIMHLYAPVPISPMLFLPVQCVRKQDNRYDVLLPNAQVIEIYQQKFWPSDLLHSTIDSEQIIWFQDFSIGSAQFFRGQRQWKSNDI